MKTSNGFANVLQFVNGSLRTSFELNLLEFDRWDDATNEFVAIIGGLKATTSTVQTVLFPRLTPTLVKCWRNTTQPSEACRSFNSA